MNLLSVSTRFVAAAAIATALSTSASAQIELTTNGDFETGDLTGWTSFVDAPSTFTVTSDASSGASAGEIVNNVPPSGAVIKQANIGIGIVNPGDELIVSFDAKGTITGAGPVAFAEFFSELDGGGVSAGEILTGAPLALTEAYQTFTFNVTAGPDVSGGVTLQFNAATGAVAGSSIALFVDNVSVSTIPEPASIALLGLGGVAMLARRRRQA